LQIHFQYTTPRETTQGNEISFALIKKWLGLEMKKAPIEVIV
jgi:hypothetical protein